jgi:hypothetical protein
LLLTQFWNILISPHVHIFVELSVCTFDRVVQDERVCELFFTYFTRNIWFGFEPSI